MSIVHHARAISDVIGVDQEKIFQPRGGCRMRRKLSASKITFGAWTELWLGIRWRWNWSRWETPANSPSGNTFLTGGYHQFFLGFSAGTTNTPGGANPVDHFIGVRGPTSISSPWSRLETGAGAAYSTTELNPLKIVDGAETLATGKNPFYYPSDPRYRHYFIMRWRRESPNWRFSFLWAENATALGVDMPQATLIALMESADWATLAANVPANYSVDVSYGQLAAPNESADGNFDTFCYSFSRSHCWPDISDILIRAL